MTDCATLSRCGHAGEKNRSENTAANWLRGTPRAEAPQGRRRSLPRRSAVGAKAGTARALIKGHETLRHVDDVHWCSSVSRGADVGRALHAKSSWGWRITHQQSTSGYGWAR